MLATHGSANVTRLVSGFLQAKYAATILHTPVPISLQKDGPNTWHVTLKGGAGDAPLTFLFNDDTNSTNFNYKSKSYPMIGRSSIILDGEDKQLWYSHPSVPDSVGQPYIQAVNASTLAWTHWARTLCAMFVIRIH